MERREFLKQSALVAAAAATTKLSSAATPTNPIARRPLGKTGEHLSTPDEASLGLRWTLRHPITAALPPGDEKYFRLAMDVAQNYKPLEQHEEHTLLARATGVEPIFHLGNDV